LQAETFGCIKGSASAVLFGVTIVGASVEAFAALKMCGSTCSGITYLGGVFSFTLSVRILCFTFSAGFDFEFELIKKGDTPCIENAFKSALAYAN
jgi:hypothetical protein